MIISQHSVKSTIITLFIVCLSLLGFTTKAVINEVLDNGLQIIIKENHMAPIAALRIYVKTGSMYEQEYLGGGISHYFEHLINGGTTTTHSEKKIKQLIDYLDRQDCTTGYLVIFDFRNKKEWKQEKIQAEGKDIFAVWV